jgi:hypothetical protein
VRDGKALVRSKGPDGVLGGLGENADIANYPLDR